MSEPKLLTPRRASSILGVSQVTLRDWSNSGLLPSYRTLGGHRRYREADILGLLKRRQRPYIVQAQCRLRVMIIDDNEDFLDYLRDCLLQFHAVEAVECCNNGFAAGHRIHQFKPNTIVVDQNMKNMSGLELCRSLHEEGVTRSARIIFVSGWIADSLRRQARAFGVTTFVEKPLNLASVREHIVTEAAESAFFAGNDPRKQARSPS